MCLILICAITGALSGFSIAIIKCATELIKVEGTFSGLVILLLTVGLFMAFGQMIFLNMVMKLYD